MLLYKVAYSTVLHVTKTESPNVGKPGWKCHEIWQLLWRFSETSSAVCNCWVLTLLHCYCHLVVIIITIDIVTIIITIMDIVLVLSGCECY